ncbi:MAG: hypothetical protein A2289_14220 [Deltaproteobacteria bacterium RIFOXYA12_FULL_58_15]|nr:MAG: hypothetical protein A2289_14220 [Deltaproteobacteria bacterium RIFOXYA12_FULL_58_15]OGR13594.1 MAG: hypothetical protein A2341_22750 [Deltaproteobacteria bacterium RIFOXYB12_FULL_58_9]
MELKLIALVTCKQLSFTELLNTPTENMVSALEMLSESTAVPLLKGQLKTILTAYVAAKQFKTVDINRFTNAMATLRKNPVTWKQMNKEGSGNIIEAAEQAILGARFRSLAQRW